MARRRRSALGGLNLGVAAVTRSTRRATHRPPARTAAQIVTRAARTTTRVAQPRPAPRVRQRAREPLPPSYNARRARQAQRAQRKRAPLQHRGREPLDQSFNAHVAREVEREQRRRASKSIQTRFPAQQRVTGGRGPVGTPGGPRRLSPAFALSPFGRRFFQRFGASYQAQRRGPGGGSGVVRAGPLVLGAANPQSFGVSALEQTTRPLHGIAGGIYAAQSGRNVLSGIGRGLANRDKYTFSDVLRKAGFGGTAAGIAGFGLDVAADPTTYLSFGASTVPKALGRGAERKIAAQATRAAKAAGATDAEATHAVRVAKALALRDVRANRGLTVGLRAAGREVKTSGRATARVARQVGLTRGGRAVRDTRAVQTAGQLLRPDFRPKGIPEAQWRRVRAAERQSRSMRQAGTKAAQDRSVAYVRALRGRGHERVIDAIESPGAIGQANQDFWDALRAAAAARRAGDTRAEQAALRAALRAEQRFKAATTHLSDREQRVANAVRRDLAEAHRQEYDAGLVGDPLPDYFPHKLRAKLVPGHAKKLTAGKRAQLESSKQRTLRDTIRGLKAQGFDEFSTDVPLVVGARLTQSAHARANAHLIAELVATGRSFRPAVGAGEAVYEVSKRDLPRKLSSKEADELRLAIREDGFRDALKGRDIRMLNEQLVEHVTRLTVPHPGAMRDFGRWFDRALQGKFKTLVTVPNPQYHLTNLYGDAFNAYLADTRLLSSTNAVHSARALRRLAKRDAARRTLAATLDPSNRGLRIRGRRVTYDALIEEAERVGAIRTGFVGRDLVEVLDAMGKEGAEKVGQGRFARRVPGLGRFTSSKPGRVVAHPIDQLRNVSQYREDFIRLATYIEGRKRGLSPAEASDRVAKHHFDYGDLTDFERTVLRRVFPFYTFTARNTPLQVSKFLTRPGKYATLQKAREEGAKASGLPEGYEENLTPYQARQQPVPLPFSIPGVTSGDRNLLNAKLPSTDIGRLAPDLKEQLQYLTGMATPFARVPLEFGLNYSSFFRGPIDELFEKSGGAVQDYAPAPQWLGEAVKTVGGEGALRAIGLRKAPARKGGPVVWVWPKRVNYLYGNLGPAASVAQRVGNPAENQSGQGSSERLFNFLTGLNVYPYDETRTKAEALYNERDRLDALAQLYRRDGRDRDRRGNILPAYRKLLDRLNRVNKRLESGGGGNPLGFPSSGGSKNPLGF